MWQKNTPKPHKHEIAQKYYRLLQSKAFKIYGSKCKICGNTDIRILELNHINGNGKQDKHTHKCTLYHSILNGTRKDEFDLRCSNHNILYEYERGRRKDWDQNFGRTSPLDILITEVPTLDGSFTKDYLFDYSKT